MSGIKYKILAVIFSLLLGFQLSGQNTGNYDKEIDKILKKIQQYPGRTKDLAKLKENFDAANTIDSVYVISLLQSGEPDIWLRIYNEYLKMDARQKKILSVPEKSLKLAGIRTVDYNWNLNDSKHKATAYYYALGEKMMQSEDPKNARQAYRDFQQVAALDPSYKELDKMLRKAILKGSSSVEFELDNRTGKNISPGMADQLTGIIWEFKKAKYGQSKPDTTDNSFPFVLRVVLDDFQAGSDKYKELQYQEERDVYRGDVVVDTIKCLVTETRQFKKAMLAGSLEYIDKKAGKVVNRVPVKVESVFRNSYGTLQGDPDAAGDETRLLLKSKKADYPSAERMISDATDEFIKKAGEIILSE